MKYLWILFVLFSACSTPAPVDSSAQSQKVEESFALDQSKLDSLIAGDSNGPVHPPKVEQKKKPTKTEGRIPKKKAEIKKSDAKVVPVAPSVVTGDTLPADYPVSYSELDKKSKPIWDQVRAPNRKGEKSVFRVKFLGITVGDAVIENMGLTTMAERSAFYYQLRLKSASFYSSIYYLDDLLESHVDRETLTPLRYSVRQRETKQDVDDLQLFSPKERKTYFWYRRLKKADGSEKKKQVEAFTPRYFLDHFSGFHLIRGLPLDKLKNVEFPLVSRAELSLMQLKFLQEETIEIMGKDIKAWKIAVEAKFHDGLKKKGDIVFWYEAGGAYRLLKFEGRIKIGTAKGELVSYTPGVEEL